MYPSRVAEVQLIEARAITRHLPRCHWAYAEVYQPLVLKAKKVLDHDFRRKYGYRWSGRIDIYFGAMNMRSEKEWVYVQRGSECFDDGFAQIVYDEESTLTVIYVFFHDGLEFRQIEIGSAQLCIFGAKLEADDSASIPGIVVDNELTQVAKTRISLALREEVV